MPPGTVDHRNVLGFSRDRTRLWEVDREVEDPGDWDVFVNLHEEDGEVRAGDWGGYAYRLDEETGEILERTFVE